MSMNHHLLITMIASTVMLACRPYGNSELAEDGTQTAGAFSVALAMEAGKLKITASGVPAGHLPSLLLRAVEISGGGTSSVAVAKANTPISIQPLFRVKVSAGEQLTCIVESVAVGASSAGSCVNLQGDFAKFCTEAKGLLSPNQQACSCEEGTGRVLTARDVLSAQGQIDKQKFMAACAGDTAQSPGTPQGPATPDNLIPGQFPGNPPPAAGSGTQGPSRETTFASTCDSFPGGMYFTEVDTHMCRCAEAGPFVYFDSISADSEIVSGLKSACGIP